MRKTKIDEPVMVRYNVKPDTSTLNDRLSIRTQYPLRVSVYALLHKLTNYHSKDSDKKYIYLICYATTNHVLSVADLSTVTTLKR